MSLLSDLRAACGGPAAAALPPAAPEAPTACPFAFGPWDAPRGPDGRPCGAPGEAQRAVWHQGSLVAWQRRVLHRWVPLVGEPDGPDTFTHTLITPSGDQIISSLHQQAVLEELAIRLGLLPLK